MGLINDKILSLTVKEKGIFDKAVKKRSEETTELTDKINIDDLIHNYKNMKRKR